MAHTQTRSRSHRKRLPPRTKYLLRADFSADDQGYANTQTLDTREEGVEVGSLLIGETDGTIALASEKLSLTASAGGGWDKLGFVSNGMARRTGRTWFYTTNFADDANAALLGFADAGTFTQADLVGWLYFAANDNIYWQTDAGSGSEYKQLETYSGTTEYQVALCMGGYDGAQVPYTPKAKPYDLSVAKASYTYGCTAFIKGGAFTDWTMLWRSFNNNAGALYVERQDDKLAGTMDNIRVPDVNLSEVLTPVAFSAFYASNGTSLDAYQPDEGNVWVEQSGDWDIQTQRANPDGAGIATVETPYSDVMVLCIVNGGTGDQPAIVLRFSDTSNYWYVQADRANNQFELHEYNATVDTVRANAGVTINNSTDYDLQVSANGQTITGHLDNAVGSRVSYASAALNETEKLHGIRAENTAGQFDNFHVHAKSGKPYQIFDKVYP